jgi:hypothetical protein
VRGRARGARHARVEVEGGSRRRTQLPQMGGWVGGEEGRFRRTHLTRARRALTRRRMSWCRYTSALLACVFVCVRLCVFVCVRACVRACCVSVGVCGLGEERKGAHGADLRATDVLRQRSVDLEDGRLEVCQDLVEEGTA